MASDEPKIARVAILFPRRFWRYAIFRAYLRLVSEASKYYLGWFWWFLEPAALIGVLYLVFTHIRPTEVDNFVFFLVVGVTTWLWFSHAVANATQSLVVAKTLVSQFKLPKLVFPMVVVFTSCYRQLFLLPVVLILIGVGLGWSVHWIALPLLLLAQLLLIVAVATTTAFLCTWIADLRFVVNAGLQLLMFCSGVFFPLSALPEPFATILRLNPMAVLIENYRLVLLDGAWPDVAWLGVVLGVSVLWIGSVQWVFRRHDQMLTRRIVAA